ncbi:hemolysin [Klebsiella pneumoniae]|uniref:Hemolysin n=1 Tax=Klebsiella pneumoniae TaxID=573 RepID=A0A377WHZ6_KLEPN|nr:hemolysin [Klebsiella pneumoniae]
MRKSFNQFADRHRHLKGLDTVEQVLEYLNIRCAIPAHDLEQIPEYGPLVIIANHPTGTLDGLALLYAVSRVRRDVKVVTNRMLTHLEPLSSLFIPVDNIHGRTAKAALQQMDQQLQAGGVLIFFPAGEVSRLTRHGIRDKKWHSGFIKLAAKYRAPLLPAWINARNSALFYASTLISDQPAAAPADAADVSPAQQQPAGAHRPADPLVELVRCAVQRSRAYRPLLSAP